MAPASTVVSRAGEASVSSRISAHIRSNVVAYIGLFCFATAGTAGALPGKNTVDSGDIVNRQVKGADLRPAAVKRSKLAAGAVASRQVADGSLVGADLGANALGGEQIAEASLDPAILQRRIGAACPVGQAIRQVAQDGGVACQSALLGGPPTGPAGGDLTETYPAPRIAAGAVNSAKVADGSLGGADIDEFQVPLGGAVNPGVPSDLTGSVATPQILPGAVGQPEVGTLGESLSSTFACNPSSTTYVACRNVTIPGADGDLFLAVANLGWHGDAFGAAGDCVINNLGIIGSVRFGETSDSTDATHPGNATVLAVGEVFDDDDDPNRALSVQCRETEPDIAIVDGQLWVITIP